MVFNALANEREANWISYKLLEQTVFSAGQLEYRVVNLTQCIEDEILVPLGEALTLVGEDGQIQQFTAATSRYIHRVEVLEGSKEDMIGGVGSMCLRNEHSLQTFRARSALDASFTSTLAHDHPGIDRRRGDIPPPDATLPNSEGG
ncbi:hypothetical protein B0H16DRAFT_1452923 [Mycena metata]|uniref:Uncharacterized protein n=1 Tax=Mycena metata TaxID=1033252 RepID=A0AAD7NPJ4_9AGAR|nr:hypothetical protein B0H16DRAFT_1452923 [Mycena metata]